MKGYRGICIAAIAIAGCMVWASLSFADPVEVKLNPTGYASFGMGQIVNAESDQPKGSDFNNYANGPQFDHLLMQRMFVGFNLQTVYNPLPIQTNLGVEMKIYNQTPRAISSNADQGQSQRFFYFTYLTRADFIYSGGKSFNLDFGYFPFKYNPDARNLGEYLFRTGTYPQYIQTNFDFPLARVAGLKLYGTPIDGFNWNALITMNIDGAIMGDLNLTGIVSYQPIKLLEIGGGVSFCSIISANTDRTHPTVAGGASGNPSDMYGDSANPSTYTFAGTKVMARISIDSKELLPGELKSLFGKNDLKLYGEAAILGVKNYPVSLDSSTRYTDILKRTPVMFGINLPTFKILDILSIEGEWFGSPYPNDMSEIVRFGVPTPLNSTTANSGVSAYADSTKNKWKWSVYAKKTIADHFSVVVQVAKDHYRWELNDYGAQAQFGMVEALRKPGNFYYTAKVGYDF